MKKAILYVGNFVFPDGNASGKRVLGNACILRDLGYKVFCLGVNMTNEEQGFNNYEDITYCSIPYVNGLKRLNNSKPYSMILTLINDIKNQGYGLSSIIMYGSLGSTTLNKKLIKFGRHNHIAVYYDHVDIFPTPQKKPFMRYIAKLYENRQLAQKVFRKCDGIICISSYLSDMHSSYTKTVVIPPVVCKNRAALNNDKEKIKIVYAGTVSDKDRPISEWKDRIDLIIDAAYSMAVEGMVKIQFDFIGFTQADFIGMLPVNLKNDYKKKLRKIEKIAVFHGSMPSNDTIDLIRKSDFSVLLRDDKVTTKAGFPTKVSESVSCGIPVIANATSDIKEYIQNNHNGFIIEKETLADRLRLVCEMESSKIDQMKDNCYHTLSFIYKEYIGVMSNFLEKEIV